MLKMMAAVTAVLGSLSTVSCSRPTKSGREEFQYWENKASLICQTFAEATSHKIRELFSDDGSDRTDLECMPSVELCIWWEGVGIFLERDRDWLGIPAGDQIGVLLLNHPHTLMNNQPDFDPEDYGRTKFKILFCTGDRVVIWDEQEMCVWKESDYEGALKMIVCWLVSRIAELAMHHPLLFIQLAGVSDRLASILEE